MVLDPHESIFLIPMKGKKFAEFRFKPAKQIKALLDEYNIPYEESNERFYGHLLENCKQQKLTKYKVACNTGERPYHVFFFTADIIDKVLEYYKVPFEKEVR